MTHKKYPVAKPELTAREKRYVNEALDAGEISSKGSFVPRFEEAFAAAIGVRHAVACSSGTTALTLALAALGIGPGDEVIVPDFTMVASAWAVAYLGATPVFVDCDETGCIDPSLIEKAVTGKTRAVMPVHIYGRPCHMEKIMEIARRRNLHVVEDCAEATGASFGGRKVGSFGVANAFSLFANKIITAGEGGVVTTDDQFVADELRRLRSMYFEPRHTFLHQKLGYNFRMTNLQAAVALAQTERLPEIIEKRWHLQRWYDRALRINQGGPWDMLTRLANYDAANEVLWMYDILLPPPISSKVRNELMDNLEGDGIETRMMFKPMSWQPSLGGHGGETCEPPQASEFAKRGLYLPTYNELTEDDVKAIAERVLAHL